MLLSSRLVHATKTSVSAMLAARSTSGEVVVPWTVATSRRSNRVPAGFSGPT